MARYYKSWKTNFKSTFAPLPVDYMAEKLQGKQQERDIVENMLTGDYNPIYDERIANPEYVAQKRQEFQSDLQSLQDDLIGTTDFTNMIQKIYGVRQKYGMSPGSGGIPTGYSLTTSSGKKSSTSSNNNITSGTEWQYWSPEAKMDYNYNEIQKTEEAYNKMNSPLKDMYKYVNVDRTLQQVRDETGGDPYKQDILHLTVETPYDENKFQSRLATMSKGFKEDGNTWVNEGQKYLTYGRNLYVTEDDVRGDLYSGLLGYVWNDEEWNRYQEVSYIYHKEKLGDINSSAYADYWLSSQAETQLQNEYKSKYGSKWQKKYEQDMKNGVIQNKISSISQQQYNDAVKQLMEQGYTQQQAEQLAQDNFGLQGYKLQNALITVDEHVRREAHFKPGSYTIKENPDYKLIRDKKLALYTYQLEHKGALYVNETNLTGLDKKQRRKILDDIWNTNLDVNASARSFEQLLNGYNNALEGTNQDIINAFLQSGIIAKKDNGTLMVSKDYNGNNDLVSLVADYNKAYLANQEAQQMQSNIDLQRRTMAEAYLNTDEGKQWIDKIKQYDPNITKQDLVNRIVNDENIVDYEEDWGRYKPIEPGYNTHKTISAQDIIDDMKDYFADPENGFNPKNFSYRVTMNKKDEKQIKTYFDTQVLTTSFRDPVRDKSIYEIAKDEGIKEKNITNIEYDPNGSWTLNASSLGVYYSIPIKINYIDKDGKKQSKTIVVNANDQSTNTVISLSQTLAGFSQDKYAGILGDTNYAETNYWDPSAVGESASGALMGIGLAQLSTSNSYNNLYAAGQIDNVKTLKDGQQIKLNTLDGYTFVVRNANGRKEMGYEDNSGNFQSLDIGVNDANQVIYAIGNLHYLNNQGVDLSEAKPKKFTNLTYSEYEYQQGTNTNQ